MTSNGSTVQVPPEEVYALASRLADQSAPAEEIASRFASPPAVAGPLQPAVEDLFTCHRAAARALAGEFGWLGSTLASVVDSWLHLDGSLLAPRGSATPR